MWMMCSEWQKWLRISPVASWGTCCSSALLKRHRGNNTLAPMKAWHHIPKRLHHEKSASRCKNSGITVWYRWWTGICTFRNSQHLEHFWSCHHIYIYIYYQHISIAAVMKSGHDPNSLCIFQMKWKNVFLPPQSMQSKFLSSLLEGFLCLDRL